MGAGLGAHFGHCDLYTLIEVEDGQIKDTKVVPNVPHQQGGCMAPVQTTWPGTASRCSSPAAWACVP